MRLTLKGFTSYREEQSVDFTDFEVFAVTGPMGSGKSSLLDALTYALYGRVERVGNQCAQLISQGMPRLTVQLDFRVGPGLYRIVRSTPRVGPSHVALERLAEDGSASSYGEGADRIADCRELIQQLIGLDYDAFTRSVLLPQGKFAALLTGEPAKRREILSELLGLQLFDRLGKRAGRIAHEARDLADAKESVLKLDFAGVSTDAHAQAQRQATSERERAEALIQAQAELTTLQGRWEQEQRAAERLAKAAAQLRTAVGSLREVITALERITPAMAEARKKLAQSAKDLKDCRVQAEAARAARGESETRWGGAGALAKARAVAVHADDLDQKCRELEGKLATAKLTLPKLAAQLDERKGQLRDAKQALLKARERVAEAKAQLEAAQHANRLAAISVGLRRGDLCPVCGVVLAKAPRHVASELTAAERDLQKTERAYEDAQELAQRCGLALQKAEDVQTRAAEGVEGDRKELALAKGKLAKARGAVSAALGPEPIDKAVAEFDRRLRKLESLQSAERAATTAVDAAATAAAKARAALDQLDGEATRQRAHAQALLTSMPVQLEALESTDLAGLALVELPDETTSAEAIVPAIELNAQVLAKSAERLDRVYGARRASEEIVAAAKSIAEKHALAGATIALLCEAAAAAAKDAGTRAAGAERDVAHMAERLEHRGTIEAEIGVHRLRGATFGALAMELRADHIVAFLQTEALQVLAHAASGYLAQFADGRYRLTCRDDDEFCVVDAWNGDEVRSVETLSGGETFVTSLALALALSDQLRLLSVAERAELDSLFLDEGFGSLDPDTLATVTAAIYQLAGDGRLIGVITHVPELAEQFTRIVVEKSPRGSRLRVVA